MDRNGTKKKVVVIGNGIGGTRFTAALNAAVTKSKKDISITVLSPTEYHEIQLCMTKVIATDAAEHNTALFPLVREDNVNYVFGACQQLSDSSLVTSSGETIQFDVCVVATGINYHIFQAGPDHPTIDTRKQFIKSFQSKIQAANTIVISGGGPIGCECASDIKVRYPTKRVILVCSEIISTLPSAMSALCKDALIRQEVELMLNDHVASFADGKVVTRAGKTIETDLYIPGYGMGPNTAFVPDALKDSKGYLKVTDNLNCEANPKVFAIGSCSSLDTAKVVLTIDDMAPTLVANVIAAVESRPLKAYKRGFMGSLTGPVLVALGHGHPDGFGVGPNLPGCPGFCCWLCCCVGMPCSTPAGAGAAKIKSDFNKSLKPVKGGGIK